MHHRGGAEDAETATITYSVAGDCWQISAAFPRYQVLLCVLGVSAVNYPGRIAPKQKPGPLAGAGSLRFQKVGPPAESHPGRTQRARRYLACALFLFLLLLLLLLVIFLVLVLPLVLAASFIEDVAEDEYDEDGRLSQRMNSISW